MQINNGENIYFPLTCRHVWDDRYLLTCDKIYCAEILFMETQKKKVKGIVHNMYLKAKQLESLHTALCATGIFLKVYINVLKLCLIGKQRNICYDLCDYA